MANELMKVEFQSLSGIAVQLDADTVRRTLTRGNGKVSDQEVAMFIRTCQAKKLDPFENGEVYLIKYDDKAPANLVVGYFAYIRRADHFPDYRGFKAGITVVRKKPDGDIDVIQKEGTCIYKALGEELIGGWCRVFRDRGNGVIEENFTEVSLDEYSTGKSNWNAKPATMIRKVAVSQAFRSAFPNEYEGLYTVDEMEASGAIPADYTIVPETGEVIENQRDEDPVATKEQLQAVFNTIKREFGKENANDIWKDLLKEQGLECSEGMRVSTMGNIISRVMEIASEMHSMDSSSSGSESGVTTAE